MKDSHAQNSTENRIKVRTQYLQHLLLLASRSVDQEGAMACYEEALTIDNQCMTALRGKANILLQQGLEQEAFTVYQQMLAIKPKDTFALQGINKIRERKRLAEPEVIPPQFTKTYLSKLGGGQTLLDIKQYQAALKIFQELLAQKATATAAVTLGIATAYEGMGDLDAALASYYRLSKYPAYQQAAEAACCRIKSILQEQEYKQQREYWLRKAPRRIAKACLKGAIDGLPKTEFAQAIPGICIGGEIGEKLKGNLLNVIADRIQTKQCIHAEFRQQQEDRLVRYLSLALKEVLTLHSSIFTKKATNKITFKHRVTDPATDNTLLKLLNEAIQSYKDNRLLIEQPSVPMVTQANCPSESSSTSQTLSNGAWRYRLLRQRPEYHQLEPEEPKNSTSSYNLASCSFF